MQMNCVIAETLTTAKTFKSRLNFREWFSEINTNKLQNYNPFLWDSVHQQLVLSDSMMTNYILSLLIFNISIGLKLCCLFIICHLNFIKIDMVMAEALLYNWILILIHFITLLQKLTAEFQCWTFLKACLQGCLVTVCSKALCGQSFAKANLMM